MILNEHCMSLPLHPMLPFVHLPKAPKKHLCHFLADWDMILTMKTHKSSFSCITMGGRLYVTSTTGQTLYALLKFPKGINPSTTI